MTEENFDNYHSLKLIEALTSLIENKEVDREGVEYLKHTLTYIPWNPLIADSWNELLKLMDGQLKQITDEQEYKQELLGYVDEFSIPEQKFEIYQVLITYFFQNNKFDQALNEVNKQIELTNNIEDNVFQCRAFQTKGVIYHVLGQVEKSEEWYKKSYSLLENINEDQHYQLHDRVLYSLANLYQHYLGDFEQALEYYELAYKMAKRMENLEREAFFLDHMGMAEFWLDNPEKAIEFHDQAWKLLQDQDRSVNVLFHKVQLSMALAKLNEYDRVGEELLDVADLKVKNIDPYSNTLYLLLLSQYWRNKPDNFNLLQEKFKNKLNYNSISPMMLMEQAKQTALQSQHIPSIVTANLELAKYKMEDDTAEAMVLLSEAKQLSIQNSRYREVEEVKRVVGLIGLDYDTL